MIDDLSALRDYVARLEGYLAKEELQHEKTKLALEKARKHISDQALDIVTLGQEVGRLREALQDIASGRYSGVLLTSFPPKDPAVERARAALAEKEEK